MNGQTKEGARQPVEILHIDTVGSQEFFARVDANDSEICDCQKVLHETFQQCCQQCDGYVAKNWQGDGGHAFFPASKKSGGSVSAARLFISKLPILAQQTATILNRGIPADAARRRFRVKAHFGLVRVSEENIYDAGTSADFFAFLKHEKELATVPDELYITEQLRNQLGGAEKNLFKLHIPTAKYGLLETAMYRLEWKQTNHNRSPFFDPKMDPKDITPSEWNYLKKWLNSQRKNVSARNSITTGLIAKLEEKSQINHEDLISLTIRALYNYLRAVYPHYSFNVAVWRPNATRELTKCAQYPTTINRPRTVSLSDVQFQVVQAFKSCNAFVTPCVTESRLAGEWIDFDQSQQVLTRGLQSAIQIPVYRTTNARGSFVEKECLGVLSVDSDKPDLFRNEEIDIWCEDLIGYLANFALAERLFRRGGGGTSTKTGIRVD